MSNQDRYEIKSEQKWAIISLMESPNNSSISANRQIALAAGTVMIAYVFSSVINLAKGVVILRAFGTGMENEAFWAANRVSEVLFNLVAGGALASAFIPTFSSFLARKQKENAWKLASAIINLVFLIISILAILAAIFAPQVVRYILAPGFVGDPEKFQLTVQLLRIILPSTVIFSISGLIMGILNAHQSFLFPALAPSMYSLGMIFGVLFLSPSMGIFGLAWGVVLGASFHLIVQLPKLFKLGGNYWPVLGLNNSAVREVGTLMLPRLAGVAVVQLNFLVNTNLASRYSEGSVTGLTYGFTLMLMPLMLIAQAIAIASLPTFSAQAALGKLDEMRNSLSTALRAVFMLSIPAAVGMIILRYPLIKVLYENGTTFTTESTELVAWALLWYTVGLVGHSAVEILSRAFYAMKDTKTPVVVGVIAMSINIMLSILLGSLFLRIGWLAIGGLALANSIATGLESIVLLIILRKRMNGLEGRKIFILLVKVTVAVSLMGIAIGWLVNSVALSDGVTLVIGAILGGGLYAGLLLALRVEDFTVLVKYFMRKLNRKRA
ncbi:MAG: murein biosynthesis integral membrane protein MurJ [Anaerolineaceae bacterium]|nr:murein biosynthesis integral membrane protein MurJ [Anaerolineaceae bacterium]